VVSYSETAAPHHRGRGVGGGGGDSGRGGGGGGGAAAAAGREGGGRASGRGEGLNYVLEDYDDMERVYKAKEETLRLKKERTVEPRPELFQKKVDHFDAGGGDGSINCEGINLEQQAAAAKQEAPLARCRVPHASNVDDMNETKDTLTRYTRSSRASQPARPSQTSSPPQNICSVSVEDSVLSKLADLCCHEQSTYVDGPSSDGPLRGRTAAEHLSERKDVDIGARGGGASAVGGGGGGGGGDGGGGERCGMAANDTLTQV
jgi:hypothetical protein